MTLHLLKITNKMNQHIYSIEVARSKV